MGLFGGLIRRRVNNSGTGQFGPRKTLKAENPRGGGKVAGFPRPELTRPQLPPKPVCYAG